MKLKSLQLNYVIGRNSKFRFKILLYNSILKAVFYYKIHKWDTTLNLEQIQMLVQELLQVSAGM